MASPETVRLSIAAAMTLGLKRGKFYRNAKLGCINLLMEYDNGCIANCLYCGQAREITDGPDCKSLIRVDWPSYPLSEVIAATKRAAGKDRFVQRVCISTLTSPGAPEDLVQMVKAVKTGTGLRVSTLITPTSFRKKDLEAVRAAGAENITVAVDTATPELFYRLRGKGARGPHTWDAYINGIKDAVDVMGNGQSEASPRLRAGLPGEEVDHFLKAPLDPVLTHGACGERAGNGGVGVHLIVGLGETEEDAVRMIQRCSDMGVRVHLFSFFPEKGSAMETSPQPPMGQYRRVQLARHLIDQKKSRLAQMRFERGRLVDFGLPGHDILAVIEKGTPFMTSGCPGCNRPFANETPTQAMQGLFRNYPFQPNGEDIERIKNQMDFQRT